MKLILPVVVLLVILVGVSKGESSNINPLADVYILCNTQSYTNGSLFSKGLTSVVAALKKEASSTRYHATTSRNVMGAFQCRGDLSQHACSDCVSQASQSALDGCPNAIGSRVQLDGCFLRYENYSFFTQDSSIVVELCNTQKLNISSAQSHVTRLLNHVTTAAPNSQTLYASATSSIPANVASSNSTRLYALAQCLGYLSSSQCSDCLAAHSTSWQDCDNAVGAQIHSVSCYYRYEIYPFFFQ